MSRIPEYRSWYGMMKRCYDKKHPFYNNYGKRGIDVCDRWHVYANFLADMEKKPSKKHTIERIDNDKGYTPSNCRWATRQEQARNRSYQRRITVNGVTKLLIEWCNETGLNHPTIIKRLARGWTPERAILTPGSGKPHSSKRTHCPQGHEYNQENTRIKKTPTGTERSCRICQKEGKKARRLKSVRAE